MKYKAVFIVIMIILIAESLLTGFIPHTRGYLFELLEAKGGAIYVALGVYFLNYLFLDGFQAVKEYMLIKYSLYFRTDRTNEVIKNIKPGVSNTPQRIQEDIKISYLKRFIVWAEYFISGTIVIQLLIINLSEPILVVSALVYAGISVIIAMKFNPKMTKTQRNMQQQEATYRVKLTNAIDIAHLPVANKATMMAAKVKMHYLLFTKLQLGLLTVLPYAVMIPSLIAGEISLGTLVMHQATFALIVVNAAILIQFYPKLIEGRASERRVKDIEGE